MLHIWILVFCINEIHLVPVSKKKGLLFANPIDQMCVHRHDYFQFKTISRLTCLLHFVMDFKLLLYCLLSNTTISQSWCFIRIHIFRMVTSFGYMNAFAMLLSLRLGSTFCVFLSGSFFFSVGPMHCSWDPQVSSFSNFFF